MAPSHLQVHLCSALHNIIWNVTMFEWRSNTYCLVHLNEVLCKHVESQQDLRTIKHTFNDCNFILSNFCLFFTLLTKVHGVSLVLASAWRLLMVLDDESVTCHTTFSIKLFCQHIPWSTNLLWILSCTQSWNNKTSNCLLKNSRLRTWSTFANSCTQYKSNYAFYS